MKLDEIAAVLFKEEEEFTTIQNALKAYSTLLERVSNEELMNDSLTRTNLHFENGIAIGTSWAASCLDDVLRTKRFVRGIHLAIESIRALKQEPIHIFYVGTGPFATLLLPIFAAYPPNIVQASLLEINPVSFQNMQSVVKKLGFEEHIRAYHLADATTFQIPEPDSIDILLCETMQHALQKEQQVPIMYNLVPQMSEKALLIPEKINLDIVLLPNTASTEQPAIVLGRAFELSKKAIQDNPEKGMVLQKRKLSISAQNPAGLLAIQTTLQLFDDQLLTHYDSGLSVPKILFPVKEGALTSVVISTEYQVGEDNGLAVKLGL